MGDGNAALGRGGGVEGNGDCVFCSSGDCDGPGLGLCCIGGSAVPGARRAGEDTNIPSWAGIEASTVRWIDPSADVLLQGFGCGVALTELGAAARGLGSSLKKIRTKGSEKKN